MGLEYFIQTAMNSVLKNPVVQVLRDINFSTILKQSNFTQLSHIKNHQFLMYKSFAKAHK